MKQSLKLFAFCLGAAMASGAFAQQPVAAQPAAAAKPSAAETLSALAEGRISGVQNIKRDAMGGITSLVVIGRADVSRSMMANQAELFAARIAASDAQRRFREWMSTKVEATYSQKSGLELRTKGSAAGDTGPASATQTSDARMLTSDEIKTVTEGIVAGLQTIYEGVNSRGMYVIVYGWSAKNTAQISAVNALMQDALRTPAQNAGGQGAWGGAWGQGGAAGQGNIRAVQPGGSVSNDAAEFL